MNPAIKSKLDEFKARREKFYTGDEEMRTEHAQLEASLRVALDALAVYSDKSTYHIMDYGRNYVSNLVVEDYDSDKPIEDRAKEALERISKILEAK